MKYQCTLIVVKDIEKSKKFYYDVLGLEVIADFGANAMLTGGIALQTLETWEKFIHKPESSIIFGNNAAELYFEEEEMEDFIEKLENIQGIVYVHPQIEHAWGQKVVRFYDPDQHIIEVGESMKNVAKRFLDSGLTIEQTAKRMDVSPDDVRAFLE